MESEDAAGRFGKEKRMLEEKVQDSSVRLIDEEERAKSSLKQKNKAEILAVVDLQDELEREKVARNEAEAVKRVFDDELREEKEASAERLRKIEEFAQVISRKDSE